MRLLRHQEVGPRGLTPYVLWREDVDSFVRYQEQQHEPAHRDLENYPYWAAFVVTPLAETLFAGMYSARFIGMSGAPMMRLVKRIELPAGQYIYSAVLYEGLRDYIGRVVVHWGKGTRTWAQRADLQARILEIRTRFEEPAFPGHLDFIQAYLGSNSYPQHG